MCAGQGETGGSQARGSQARGSMPAAKRQRRAELAAMASQPVGVAGGSRETEDAREQEEDADEDLFAGLRGTEGGWAASACCFCRRPLQVSTLRGRSRWLCEQTCPTACCAQSCFRSVSTWYTDVALRLPGLRRGRLRITRCS